MKNSKLLFFCSAIFCASASAQAQGFINLNFESAKLVPAGPFEVQFDQAFPGWIGTVGGVQQTLAISNSVALDSSGISIINSGYNSYGLIAGGLIQGKYTAIIQAGIGGIHLFLKPDWCLLARNHSSLKLLRLLICRALLLSRSAGRRYRYRHLELARTILSMVLMLVHLPFRQNN